MKYLPFVFAGLLCFCVSCSERSSVPLKSKTNSNAQKNLDAWHTVSMAFETGNQDAINSVIADDYIDHTSRGDIKGKDSVKANIARWHANLKNVKMERIKEFADDDYAVFWMRFTGISNGQTGIPVGPFDMTTIQVVRFVDAKAVEHWNYVDMKQVMKMMSNR